jgi:hypothetical protein
VGVSNTSHFSFPLLLLLLFFFYNVVDLNETQNEHNTTCPVFIGLCSSAEGTGIAQPV